MLSVSVQELLRNPREKFLAAADVLLKYADDVLLNPNSDKYRRIKISSSGVSDVLLETKGGVECLFSMGFEEDGEYFTYPKNKDIKCLRDIRNELYEQRRNMQTPDNNIFRDNKRLVKGGLNFDRKIYPHNITELEIAFHTKLLSNFNLVMAYEDPVSQQKARDHIPLVKLKPLAEKKAEAATGENPLDKNDFLLMELVNWFKQDFFTWVDKPNCDHCGNLTTSINQLPPTYEEKMGDATRVEGYQCTSCQKIVRFPRYNQPTKLLETRKGRCGEWANCFALCCRSLGFDTRFIVDWTDHVWVEVFSNSQKRWIHVDPCENICDEPLLYEDGWGKKLTYIIAFSKDEVVDVTWRYCRDHPLVLSRRIECRETWLLDTINRLNTMRQAEFSPEKKDQILKRFANELVEFLSPQKKGDAQLPGRISGSVAWRSERGELGASKAPNQGRYTFTLSKKEIESKRFSVVYVTNENKYIRVSDNRKETVGWDCMVFEYKNIFRKVEHDWKMCYLAREGNVDGFVCWNFDFSSSALKIDRIKLFCQSTTFHTGVVQWSVVAGKRQIRFPEDENVLRTGELKGESSFIIRADLSIGDGTNAWQHTQLFRQSLEGGNDMKYPFEVIVTFQ